MAAIPSLPPPTTHTSKNRVSALCGLKHRLTFDRRLSPLLQSFLDELEVVHTSSKMINHVKAVGGLVRKDPIDTVHPLVRVHPVTGEKCLFVNGEFITRIVGLKEPEQKVLLEFLLNHLITGHDFQARVKWSPKSIVLFDNRSLIRKYTWPSVMGSTNKRCRRLCNC